MKKFRKVIDFCLPAVVYIACSLIAFSLWYIFNHAATPVITLSIILAVVGSIASGFLTRGKNGKKGMYVAIAAVVAATILWVLTYSANVSFAAYIATALSSYVNNILVCLPLDTPEYALYIGYAVSLIAPIALILFGRFLRVKILRGKA